MNKNFQKKDRSKLYQLIGILLLCFCLVSLFTNTTIAWFKDESKTSNGEPNITIIGTLDLQVTTNFNFYNLSLAPDKIYTTDINNSDIATYLNTTSEHDIVGAYVRIKFETTRINVGETEEIDNKDLLNLYFENNYTESTVYTESEKNKWVYNSADDYYYYIGGIDKTNVMFNRGYKTSNFFTNVEKDARVYISFTVEAIQRQYDAYLDVWPTAPEIFKSFASIDGDINTEHN